jgi:hypothetical protein
LNKKEEANGIIESAKLEAKGKDEWGRLDIYNKYKYKIYDLIPLGEEKPYIRQLLDALNV